MFGAQKHAANQYSESSIPILNFDLCKRPDSASKSSIVEYAIKSSKLIDSKANHRLNIFLLCNVTTSESNLVT